LLLRRGGFFGRRHKKKKRIMFRRVWVDGGTKIKEVLGWGFSVFTTRPEKK